jgi:hypothetical protein
MKLLFCLSAMLLAVPVYSQVFDPGGAPASGGGQNTTINNSQPKQENSPFLGNDTPFFDPGSETASWNGKAWNVTNNRLFRGRFEKYLSAPEDNSEKDEAYRKVMNQIIQALTPKQGALPNLSVAVGLLPVAAEFPIDARLCDAISSAVYTIWMVQKNESAMVAANKAMEKEIGNLALRVEVGSEPPKTSQPEPEAKGKKGGPTPRHPKRRPEPPPQTLRSSRAWALIWPRSLNAKPCARPTSQNLGSMS